MKYHISSANESAYSIERYYRLETIFGDDGVTYDGTNAIVEITTLQQLIDLIKHVKERIIIDDDAIIIYNDWIE